MYHHPETHLMVARHRHAELIDAAARRRLAAKSPRRSRRHHDPFTAWRTATAIRFDPEPSRPIIA